MPSRSAIRRPASPFLLMGLVDELCYALVITGSSLQASRDGGTIALSPVGGGGFWNTLLFKAQHTAAAPCYRASLGREQASLPDVARDLRAPSSAKAKFGLWAYWRTGFDHRKERPRRGKL